MELADRYNVKEDSVPAAKPPAGPQCGATTIIVVEDDPSVRRITAKVLTSDGFEVWVARHGPEALEVWQQLGCRADLLITDLQMPFGMDGLTVASTLRQSLPSLKVILISGYAQEPPQLNKLKEASIEFLPKPFPAGALLKTVRACVGGP
jgi:two-component system cell cycle sensor histidine kinase/response regulator CckA